MDTRFLESFVVVAEAGSIAAAARRLGLSPAALSQRIAALEREVGAPLLLRAGRRAAPTEAGLAVIDRARAVLLGVRDLRDRAAEGAAEGVGGGRLRGELRLGAIATALSGILPAMMLGLAEAHPGLDVHVAPGISTDLYQRVLAGELDAAVIVLPGFPLPKLCGQCLLREEPLVLLSPGALAGEDPHRLLETRPFIRYDREQWGGRLADRYLRRARIRPRERFELDALDAIAVMVDRGLGVSIVPDWAPPWPAGIAVAKHALPGAAEPRRVGLVWSRNGPRPRLVRALLAQRQGAAG